MPNTTNNRRSSSVLGEAVASYMYVCMYVLGGGDCSKQRMRCGEEEEREGLYGGERERMPWGYRKEVFHTQKTWIA